MLCARQTMMTRGSTWHVDLQSEEYCNKFPKQWRTMLQLTSYSSCASCHFLETSWSSQGDLHWVIRRHSNQWGLFVWSLIPRSMVHHSLATALHPISNTLSFKIHHTGNDLRWYDTRTSFVVIIFIRVLLFQDACHKHNWSYWSLSAGKMQSRSHVSTPAGAVGLAASKILGLIRMGLFESTLYHCEYIWT